MDNAPICRDRWVRAHIVGGFQRMVQKCDNEGCRDSHPLGREYHPSPKRRFRPIVRCACARWCHEAIRRLGPHSGQGEGGRSHGGCFPKSGSHITGGCAFLGHFLMATSNMQVRTRCKHTSRHFDLLDLDPTICHI
jgi:hypothetical protein